MRRLWLTGIFLSLLLLAGCASRAEAPVIVDEAVRGDLLGVDVPVKVYLPGGYTAESSYPVLYFIADAGGPRTPS